jgi:hypothetical protein
MMMILGVFFISILNKKMGWCYGHQESFGVPLIPKLRDAGKLTYADDEVRKGMDEIVRRGLDR